MFGSDAHGIEEEVTRVPPNLYTLVGMLTGILNVCVPVCLGSGIQRLRRCEAFRDGGGLDGSN